MLGKLDGSPWEGSSDSLESLVGLMPCQDGELLGEVVEHHVEEVMMRAPMCCCVHPGER